MTGKGAIVFAVDDDASVLRGVERLLRSAGFDARTFQSAEAFLDSYDSDATGCVILDLAMPGLDGLQLQQRLLEKDGGLPVIFLTGRGDIPASVQAMKNGAADFLTKPVDDEELLAAVRQAVWRCTVLRQEQRARAEVEIRLATLTPREREVLGYVISGKLNKQIAAALGTGEQTIKVHRARIMQKMQARTLAALIRLADRAGISAGVGE